MKYCWLHKCSWGCPVCFAYGSRKLSIFSAARSPFAACTLAFLSFAVMPALAEAACRANALGTHRVMEVDPADNLIVQGHEKSFGLKKGEVVLTFDDGPSSYQHHH